jgi:hypothetical protein
MHACVSIQTSSSLVQSFEPQMTSSHAHTIIIPHIVSRQPRDRHLKARITLRNRASVFAVLLPDLMGRCTLLLRYLSGSHFGQPDKPPTARSKLTITRDAQVAAGMAVPGGFDWTMLFNLLGLRKASGPQVMARVLDVSFFRCLKPGQAQPQSL